MGPRRGVGRGRAHLPKSSPSHTPKQAPRWKYVLVKQFDQHSHDHERVTLEGCHKEQDAREALSEYVHTNYPRYRALAEVPGWLAGYECGISQCLDMTTNVLIGRIWIERVEDVDDKT